MSTLKVTLRSVGNPDKGQCPSSSLSPSNSVEVNTIGEASKVCREYIEKYGLGGGNWSGGLVYEDGKVIARVSYNGRVWRTKTGKYSPDDEEILFCVWCEEEHPEEELHQEKDMGLLCGWCIQGIESRGEKLNIEEVVK